jgi:hypothetical protein
MESVCCVTSILQYTEYRSSADPELHRDLPLSEDLLGPCCSQLALLGLKPSDLFHLLVLACCRVPPNASLVIEQPRPSPEPVNPFRSPFVGA